MNKSIGPSHGELPYIVEGEGQVADNNLDSPTPNTFVPPPILEAAPGGAPEAATLSGQRFVRLFELPAADSDLAGLTALAAAMEDTGAARGDHPQLPSGYTYFGQFIDHDITLFRNAGAIDGSIPVEDAVQGRTPSMDLDSLYGLGPGLEPLSVYEADGVRLRVGLTTPLPGVVDAAFPNDIPRGHDPAQPKLATIIDGRNDENLVVAQTHLAFIKLHNKVADRIAARDGLSGAALFAAARASVTRHYQWLTFYDFVQRISDQVTFRDVDRNGRRFFLPNAGGAQPAELTGMPLEFSVAAFRLGHSMVRGRYQWNKFFNTNGQSGIASLGQLFQFTGSHDDLGGFDTLPGNWIVDWRRLYDFRAFAGVGRHPQMNHARRLDIQLVEPLKHLPGFPPGEIASLAERNLKRGRQLGLPSGQDLARRMGLPVLSAAQLRGGPHGAILASAGFDVATPLWYYILREAQNASNGRRLGPLGSRIVVETFSALIDFSPVSIFHAPAGSPAFKPDLPSLTPGVFTMTNMLKFVDDLNPLGD